LSPLPSAVPLWVRPWNRPRFDTDQVSDTVIRARILLGNGTIAEVTSKDELYHALPGSYGSLGLVLQATLRLQ
jgi:hypothetical protein